MHKEREHLGDGAYVESDGYHVILSANVPMTDRVFLDPHALEALIRYLIRERFVEGPSEVSNEETLENGA